MASRREEELRRKRREILSKGEEEREMRKIVVRGEGKNREGRGEEYSEKENIYLWRSDICGQRKYLYLEK